MNRLLSLTLLFTLFFLIGFSFDANAQRSPISLDSIVAGDDILFLKGLETQNRSVIDTTARRIFFQYLDEEGEVQDTSVARHHIVKAYKNIQGRRRLDTYQKGVKVRWKQRGQRKEGFVELYSAAKEAVDVMSYTDTLIEMVHVPVQYLSPHYGDPTRSDTIKMLSQIWEANEALLMFPIQDSIEECFPKIESLLLSPTYQEKKYQYIFKEMKFAMLSKDDLETGIIGSWNLSGDQIHISTIIASLPEDEDGNKQRIRCSGTYSYEFLIEDEGKKLSFEHVGPLPFVPDPEKPYEVPTVKYEAGKLHPFWYDKY